MKNFIVAFTLLFIVLGCGKTRPKKTRKNLLNTEWNMTSYVKDGESIATTLTDYKYKFDAADVLTVTTDRAVAGSWKIGLDGKPAIIYIKIVSADADGLEALTDDWKVLDLTKDYMRWEMVDNEEDSEPTILVFRK